jgi:hypothetical protein
MTSSPSSGVGLGWVSIFAGFAEGPPALCGDFAREAEIGLRQRSGRSASGLKICEACTLLCRALPVERGGTAAQRMGVRSPEHHDCAHHARHARIVLPRAANPCSARTVIFSILLQAALIAIPSTSCRHFSRASLQFHVRKAGRNGSALVLWSDGRSSG